MVKQTRKRLIKPKRKSNKRYKRNMFGGLHDISNGPLNLSDLDDLNTDEYEENELNISGISNYTDNEPNYLNDSFSDITETNNILDDSMNNTTNESESILNNFDSNSYNGSNGSLHLSDLNISNNNSLNTTREDIEGGKRQRRKTIKKRKQSNKKSRKQRGGMCFGNGVGANSYDPNFSIYNTRELTLFPYKPTN